MSCNLQLHFWQAPQKVNAASKNAPIFLQIAPDIGLKCLGGLHLKPLNNTKNAHFAQAFLGVTNAGIDGFTTLHHKPKISSSDYAKTFPI